MIYTRTSNIGIDAVISELQSELYEKVTSTWNGDIDAYGRLYKNKRDGGYVPEYFVSENDYQPIYYNDNKSGQFFFLIDDESDTDDQFLYKVKCKCVFAIDLFQTLGEGRNDQEAQRDIVQFLRDINGDYQIKGIETGVENVFRGYNHNSIKYSDISPKHIFSVTLDLNYYLTDKCT